MQAEALVVLADAVLDDHVVADLPTDPIPVVVARGDALDVKAIAVLEENAARIIAIELGVVFAIAIEHEILDAHIVHEFSTEQREQHGFLARLGILGTQTHSISHKEAARVVMNDSLLSKNGI